MKHIALLLAVLSLAAPHRSLAGQQSIWFCPFDFLPRTANYYGSSDYMSLFTSNAPWQNAARRVNVFKIYPQWASGASDADMKVQFADLRRRHIALALEAGVLTSPRDCGRMEGYGGEILIRLMRRIRDNGGDLAYVAMDEPLYFSSIYSGKGGCHVSIKQTVDNAAVNIKAALVEFPNVKFGDIEPLAPVENTNLIARYQEGIEAFKADLGRPLAFFDADLDWEAPSVPHDLKALGRMVATEAIPFGIIYDGNLTDTTSASWLQTARRHMALAESVVGAPEIVIFQSWHPQPKKLFPETDQDAFTSIINSYFTSRTRLSASRQGNQIRGVLATANGNPVALASVDVSLRYRSTTGAPGAYTLSGAIPEGATAVVLGIRINSEGTSGAANIRVMRLQFNAAGDSPVIRKFATAEDLALWSGLDGADGKPCGRIESGALHIVSFASDHLVINSAPFPITSHGTFTFQVNAAIPTSSDGSGYFSVHFMNGNKELNRSVIRFQEPVVSIGRVTTSKTGHWTVPLPAQPAAKLNSIIVTADYAGDANYWPSSVRFEGR